jgi:hypothetical protein
MRKAIAALEKVGQIHQIMDGCWLFKALLAPKLHQEHVCNIANFVWRFCTNYIPLNSITQIIAYPIPQCDSTINEEFGLGVLYWLFDAPMGYHELAVALTKRSWPSKARMLSRGPTVLCPLAQQNGPTTFIQFIHDVDSQWKALAVKSGLVIDNDTNTKIIVDNIVS